jgi:hypothetical protein
MVVGGEPGLFDSLRVGQAVATDKKKLMMGDWLVDLKGAALWEPGLPRLLEPLSLTPALAAILKPYLEWPAPAEGGSIARRVNELARQAARQLHEAIFQPDGSQTERAGIPQGVTKQRFGQQSSALPQILDPPKLEAAVSQLAGLGSGLTPAGDDYLVGVMAALWVLGYPALPPHLAAIASPKTTTLSAAFLGAAGQGQFIEPWHGLTQALFSDNVDLLTQAVDRVAQFGATSGLDALAGFSITLLNLVDKKGKGDLKGFKNL